jgi:hypothetical protein
VIVDGFEERELDGLLERSARVRWNGGEFRMRFAVPPELAPKELDASPFMSTALLPAMAFHEDLVVDGPVSPLLLRQVDAIMRIYHGWAPGLRRCSVRVADERAGEPVKERLGSLFSRGVDSFFTALHPRPTGNPELLVFCSTFDPFEEETARAKQRSSARAAAAAIGLPLAEVRMNVRELTERIIDFGDLHGAALAALAQSTSGGRRPGARLSSARGAATRFWTRSSAPRRCAWSTTPWPSAGSTRPRGSRANGPRCSRWPRSARQITPRATAVDARSA